MTAFSDFWRENPGLVQLLGISPLLAVANTAANGLGLGIATLAVLCTTNVLAAATGQRIPHAVRLPALLVIIAGFATLIELLCKAFFFDLYLTLGVFLPLIVTNCTILGRAQIATSGQHVGSALGDGLVYGIGFTVLLVTVGALRELIGQGSGFTLALLPAGGFFGLAGLVALRNALGQR